MPRQKDLFKKLVWVPHSVRLNDLVFDHGDSEAAAPALEFPKPKRMFEQYERIWNDRPNFEAKNILELGIYRGASILFWMEFFQPERIVALNLDDASIAAPAYHRHVAAKGLAGRIKTYWQTSQADVPKLREIVARNFPAPPDLVIDDASHMYEYTRVSFETIFPLLRPGALYLIEDWSWACWTNLPPDYCPAGPYLGNRVRRDRSAVQNALPRLIAEIVMTAGIMEPYMVREEGSFWQVKGMIADVSVYPDIVVVERGEADGAAFPDFKLAPLLLPGS